MDRFDSITPLLQDGIVVSRAIMAPSDTNYLRYFDTFTNTTAGKRVVQVAWGGAAGAYEDGGKVAVATTSSGDRRIDPADSFVTVMQNARGVADPMRGPSGHGPSAHVLGSRTAGLLTGVGDMYADPFMDQYPGFDPSHIGYVYTLRLAPGETAALVTFVVKGLSEVYDPRGGYPIPFKDALVSGEAVYAGPDASIPAAGSEIARVTRTARQLVAHPDLRGLTPRQRAQIVNWTLPAAQALPRFTVFEKTVPELQDAMTRGEVTSEDIVREYLARLAMYDRNGPTFRALLSLNHARSPTRAPVTPSGPPAACAARSTACRSSSRTTSTCSGCRPPAARVRWSIIVRASILTSPRACARRRGRARQGESRRVSVRRLRHQQRRRDHRQRVRSVAQHGRVERRQRDGRRDEPRGARLRHRHLQLAVESGAFASLATIRTTRGLTSRAGVMPLNTYNDAVGPMAKSVRDVALALDLVTGTDAEDAVTSEAAVHNPRLVRAGLDDRALQGHAHRRAAAALRRLHGRARGRGPMDRVMKELEAAGATVVDVAIADYDAKYRAVRGSAPGSLKSGVDGVSLARREAGRQGADDRGPARVGQAGAGERAPVRGRAAAHADGRRARTRR